MKKENKTYRIYLTCFNCERPFFKEFPFGVPLEDGEADKSCQCPYCGVKGWVRKDYFGNSHRIICYKRYKELAECWKGEDEEEV